MGSSTSQPREGHEHPTHLPKVGTPAEREWEHETRIKQVFGQNSGRYVIAFIVVLTLIALVILFY